MSVNTEILLFFIFLMMSAFFSASETAVLAIPKLRLQRLIDSKNPRAKILKKLLKKPQDLISTILIGNNIVNVATASLATIIVSYFLKNDNLGSSESSLVVVLATAITTVFLLIFGEITPKSFAIQKPETVALFGIYILRFLHFIFYPLVIALSLMSRILSKAFNTEGSNKMTVDDVRALSTLLQEHRVFESEHIDMIANIIEFSSKQVDEVMIHREDAIFMSKESTVSELIELVKQYKYTRIPVFDSSRDNIVGVFNSINLVNYLDKLDETIDFTEDSAEIIYVSKYSSLLFVLKQMQNHEMPFAFVVDEYGAVVGIVTAEDIVEYIVGDIVDENERKIKKVLKGKIGDSEFNVKGNITFEELHDSCGIKLDKEDVDIDTVAGIVWHKIGKKPEIGSIAEVSGYQLKVEQMVRNKIKVISIRKLPEVQAEQTSED